TYNANYRVSYNIIDKTDPLSLIDTNYYMEESSSISHSPTISYNFPKLWNIINISPSFNFRAKNFFRQKYKYFDLEDSLVKSKYNTGFFTELSYDYAVSMNTRFYGIMDDKT